MLPGVAQDRIARLRPVSADEVDDPYLRWSPGRTQWFRPTPDGRLSALRRSVYEHALTAIPASRRVRVATYVLAEPGVDVDATHRILAQHAADRGWHVDRERFTDEPTGHMQPARPEFHRACRRAASGFVDGVLAVGRKAMPSTDEAYEAYLRWLHQHYAFIAFLPPAHGRTPWTDR